MMRTISVGGENYRVIFQKRTEGHLTESADTASQFHFFDNRKGDNQKLKYFLLRITKQTSGNDDRLFSSPSEHVELIRVYEDGQILDQTTSQNLSENTLACKLVGENLDRIFSDEEIKLIDSNSILGQRLNSHKDKKTDAKPISNEKPAENGPKPYRKIYDPDVRDFEPAHNTMNFTQVLDLYKATYFTDLIFAHMKANKTVSELPDGRCSFTMPQNNKPMIYSKEQANLAILKSFAYRFLSGNDDRLKDLGYTNSDVKLFGRNFGKYNRIACPFANDTIISRLQFMVVSVENPTSENRFSFLVDLGSAAGATATFRFNENKPLTAAESKKLNFEGNVLSGAISGRGYAYIDPHDRYFTDITINEFEKMLDVVKKAFENINNEATPIPFWTTQNQLGIVLIPSITSAVQINMGYAKPGSIKEAIPLQLNFTDGELTGVYAIHPLEYTNTSRTAFYNPPNPPNPPKKENQQNHSPNANQTAGKTTNSSMFPEPKTTNEYQITYKESGQSENITFYDFQVKKPGVDCTIRVFEDKNAKGLLIRDRDYVNNDPSHKTAEETYFENNLGSIFSNCKIVINKECELKTMLTTQESTHKPTMG